MNYLIITYFRRIFRFFYIACTTNHDFFSSVISTLKITLYVIYRGYLKIWRWIWNLFLDWDRIFYIFMNVKHECISLFQILSQELTTFHIQRKNHWIFGLFHFLWILNMFLSNRTHYMWFMSFRSSSLLFSHCENNFFDNFTVWKWNICEDITFLSE